MTAFEISETISIPDRELSFHYFCASGPGGQNVNKVATGVHLCFDFRRSASLPQRCRDGLEGLADTRIGKDGIITIKAQRFRTREQNRADALKRLAHLLRAAGKPRKVRHPTRPTTASQKQRLEHKRQRGEIKKQRKGPGGNDFS